MRKLFLHIGVTVDGYIENEKGEFDWPVDDEWEEYINGVLRSIDGQVYGRVAHQSLAQYWPTAADQPGVSERLIEMARMMNASPKYVVTRRPYETGWSNSHIIRGEVAGEIQKLKNQPGRDIALFAGATLAQSFMEMGLLDEYRLVLNPVVLGGGTPLFKPGLSREKLELLSTRKLSSGLLVLTYAPVR